MSRRQILQKTFTNTHKIAKFTKVFSLKSFLLYSISFPGHSQILQPWERALNKQILIPLSPNFDSSLPTLLTRQSISSLSLFSCCVKLDRGDGAMQFYLLPWCPWSLAVCPVLEPLMKCVLELPRLFCKQLRIRNTGH